MLVGGGNRAARWRRHRRHRLRHLPHHVLYERVALEVPLVGLVEVAGVGRGEIVAQQYVEHVVVDVCGDGGRQYLAREAEHPAHRGEDDTAHRGAPGRVVPQRHHLRRVVPPPYEGGGQEEGGVERDAHEDVEPEHRVIAGVRGGLLVGQRHLEPAVLQGQGHEREHADDGHHAIVGGCQQAPQDDAEQQAYDLLHHRVHAAPEQSAGGLLFQCLHSSIVVIFCLQLLLFLLATVLFLLAVAFSLLAMVFFLLATVAGQAVLRAKIRFLAERAKEDPCFLKEY